MIRFKNTLHILGLLFSFSATAQDNGKGCALDVSQSKFETSGCTRNDGVTIWKLTPRDLPLYAGNLDSLPTFILAGDDLDVILKLMKSNDLPYNNFIKLPIPERILSANAAPITARVVMEKRNWKLMDLIIFLYEGNNDNEGPAMTCGTYERKRISGYVVVSQCYDLFGNEKLEFKELLDLVEAQLK